MKPGDKTQAFGRQCLVANSLAFGQLIILTIYYFRLSILWTCVSCVLSVVIRPLCPQTHLRGLVCRVSCLLSFAFSVHRLIFGDLCVVCLVCCHSASLSTDSSSGTCVSCVLSVVIRLLCPQTHLRGLVCRVSCLLSFAFSVHRLIFGDLCVVCLVCCHSPSLSTDSSSGTCVSCVLSVIRPICPQTHLRGLVCRVSCLLSFGLSVHRLIFGDLCVVCLVCCHSASVHRRIFGDLCVVCLVCCHSPSLSTDSSTGTCLSCVLSVVIRPLCPQTHLRGLVCRVSCLLSFAFSVHRLIFGDLCVVCLVCCHSASLSTDSSSGTCVSCVLSVVIRPLCPQTHLRELVCRVSCLLSFGLSVHRLIFGDLCVVCLVCCHSASLSTDSSSGTCVSCVLSVVIRPLSTDSSSGTCVSCVLSVIRPLCPQTHLRGLVCRVSCL